jgi:hypothetical protein
VLTKKHFEAFAKIVRSMRIVHGKDVAASLHLRLEEFCGDKNPNFDKERFQNACLLSETERITR